MTSRSVDVLGLKSDSRHNGAAFGARKAAVDEAGGCRGTEEALERGDLGREGTRGGGCWRQDKPSKGRWVTAQNQLALLAASLREVEAGNGLGNVGEYGMGRGSVEGSAASAGPRLPAGVGAAVLKSRHAQAQDPGSGDGGPCCRMHRRIQQDLQPSSKNRFCVRRTRHRTTLRTTRGNSSGGPRAADNSADATVSWWRRRRRGQRSTTKDLAILGAVLLVAAYIVLCSLSAPARREQTFRERLVLWHDHHSKRPNSAP
ncbi:hypothetical protein BDU57DRAFT_528069 [Ampelomyces quisqualis]|uniref:Uncharacterized protein n=1 Tax=Ampelomyces quisqualis TaxID=50730 RepID=A0A6A5QNX5_AMPQU|nr:hypothetical protein BDU57DRAFT_528069 [Ampelomyces quisqualis]